MLVSPGPKKSKYLFAQGICGARACRLIHDLANTNNCDGTDDDDDDDSTNAEAMVMFLHCQKITHGSGNQNWDVRTHNSDVGSNTQQNRF